MSVITSQYRTNMKSSQNENIEIGLLLEEVMHKLNLVG